MTAVPPDAAARIRALPLWRDLPKIAPLAGGRSNESYRVCSGGEAYVVRFGADFPVHHVYRDHEAMAARAAFRAGLAPEVVHDGPGVLVTRFLEAKTFTAADVQAEAARVVALMRRFHCALPSEVSGRANLFWVFHTINDYARTLQAGGSRHCDRLAGYRPLCDAWQQAQPPVHLVFGHNDLVPQNILDDGERLWLIDFEYAGYSSPLFDLAGLASNAGMDGAEADALLGHYFDAVPDASLRRAFAAMRGASLLREAMWSMVSELHLSAPGVDYAAYTAECLAALDTAVDSWRRRYAKASR